MSTVDTVAAEASQGFASLVGAALGTRLVCSTLGKSEVCAFGVFFDAFTDFVVLFVALVLARNTEGCLKVFGPDTWDGTRIGLVA